MIDRFRSWGTEGAMWIFMGSGADLAAYALSCRIEALAACSKSCEETARACLDRLALRSGDASALDRLRRSAMGCRGFCDLASGLLSRRGALAKEAAEACAEACLACASACDAVPEEEALACALACREAAEACEGAIRSLS